MQPGATIWQAANRVLIALQVGVQPFVFDGPSPVMAMTPTIENLRASKQSIEDAAARFGVTDFRIFGSVARGTSEEGSDLDVLVKMKSGSTLLDVIGFEQILEDELGIPVDVVEEGGIHPLLERAILAEARHL